MLLPDSKTELVRRGNKVVYDLGDKIVKVFNETKPVSDVFNASMSAASAAPRLSRFPSSRTPTAGRS